MTIAVIDLLGFRLSVGGIVALLMLIGYSVDTDILLTTRVLRKKTDSLNKRLAEALKTGLTMTLTSIVAVAVSLVIIYSISEVLRQIFTILLIGLGFDMINTWMANAGILKWYVERKK
jgi:preprotein translocase subunit SecF